jgi:hypothetical protein
MTFARQAAVQKKALFDTEAIITDQKAGGTGALHRRSRKMLKEPLSD